MTQDAALIDKIQHMTAGLLMTPESQMPESRHIKELPLSLDARLEAKRRRQRTVQSDPRIWVGSSALLSDLEQQLLDELDA